MILQKGLNVSMEKAMQILREELIPAMGCTEPIALAYAAAVARRTLGEMPDSQAI
jgi:L-cysteine desulfidase